MTDPARLVELDRQHLLHPLHHISDYDDALIFTTGEGIRLKATDGRWYIDGLAGLWNVLIGHGNIELVEATRRQMSTLAYCSNYVGASSIPTIELAERLAGYAYPGLNMTFFAAGGGEANESAFKTARYFWKRKGRPGKYKIIARQDAYHGVTLAAMSATGIAPYWPMFEPRVPGFLHVPAPNPYRFEGRIQAGETVGLAAARAIEEAILAEGPDTVAAVIAEPVQGAGGVIVPPDDYFPQVREICDRHDVLLIADEVITGFGRTGRWFGLHHWDIQPDMMSFAKGTTSGYLPLGGIQISDQIQEVILSAPPGERWMHAYTYSGHPTCCALALKNLELLETANVADNAALQGERLLAGLESLSSFPIVGNVRGLGLMCAVELVSDLERKTPAGLGGALRKACQERGLFTRIKGDILIVAPPLIINGDEVDEIVEIVRDALESITPD